MGQSGAMGGLAVLLLYLQLLGFLLGHPGFFFFSPRCDRAASVTGSCGMATSPYCAPFLSHVLEMKPLSSSCVMCGPALPLLLQGLETVKGGEGVDSMLHKVVK